MIGKKFEKARISPLRGLLTGKRDPLEFLVDLYTVFKFSLFFQESFFLIERLFLEDLFPVASR